MHGRATDGRDKLEALRHARGEHGEGARTDACKRAALRACAPTGASGIVAPKTPVQDPHHTAESKCEAPEIPIRLRPVGMAHTQVALGRGGWQ